jgi:tRNA G18 (ribose-2'-O)-methylase SpoU
LTNTPFGGILQYTPEGVFLLFTTKYSAMTNPTPNYAEIIQQTASQHYNVRDEYKDNTVEQNIAIQQSQTRKFSVGMINVTGELNIGMALRSACLMGAENFYIFGRKKFDRRSTVGAENYINIVQTVYNNPLSADQEILNDLRVLQHSVIICEQGGVRLGSEDAKDLFASSMNPLFLFGSESHGVPGIILEQRDKTGYPEYEFPRVSIPQVGVLRSFNVSAAMNIICWDYIKETHL